MILDLREFEEFPVSKSLQIGPPDQPFVVDGITRVNGVEIELAIQMAGQEYYCQGSVVAHSVVECARCLAEFETKLVGKTDFIICAKPEEVLKGDEVDSEDYVYLTGNDLRADISEPIRQAVVLALSMMPLCSTDCQGLCQKCGKNLNSHSCDCPKTGADPRWDGLKKFLSDE